MTYRLDLISGRVAVPVFGPEVDGERTLAGWRDGLHWNVPESLMTPDLEPYRVHPAEPAAVLAGVETAFLRFADEAEETAALARWAVSDA